jgi:hypothetical protein
MPTWIWIVTLIILIACLGYERYRRVLAELWVDEIVFLLEVEAPDHKIRDLIDERKPKA